MEEKKEEGKEAGVEEVEGIPKEVFEKDARFRVVSEGSGETPQPTDLKRGEEVFPEVFEEKQAEFSEKTGSEPGQKETEEALEKETAAEENVVEVEDTLERVISAPTVEASETDFPIPRQAAPTEPARFFEFDESAGLVKMEEGAVFTYGADAEPVKESSRTKWIIVAVIVLTLFLFALFLAVRLLF